MTDKEKILQGIEKWAKVMLKTGALEKTQSLSSDSWYDADEIVCSIRGYIRKEGVDLWKSDTFCGMPVSDKFYVKRTQTLMEEVEEKIDEQAKYIPSDEVIITECLNYAKHRLVKHPTCGLPMAWLPIIDKMRRKKIIGLLHEDCLNKSKKEEPKKIERINRKEWFDNYGSIARLRMLIEKQDEIIKHLNKNL